MATDVIKKEWMVIEAQMQAQDLSPDQIQFAKETFHMGAAICYRLIEENGRFTSSIEGPEGPDFYQDLREEILTFLVELNALQNFKGH